MLARPGVDDLPGQKVLPVGRDDRDDVANVVGVVVPVLLGRVAELVDQDRRAPLGEEQQGKAGRHHLVLLTASVPEPGELF